MSEWWTYTLSDFLLFSPRTYYRLLELYNQAIWPAQLVGAAMGAAIVALMVAPRVGRERVVAGLLAACWLWIAWAFHWQRYAQINWAAPWFAAAFALEALLLVVLGVAAKRIVWPARELRIGAAFFAIIVAGYPLLAPLAGRSWTTAETFGVAADPTAIATVAALALARGRARWALLAIPLLWCATAALTLWAMDSPQALIVACATLLALYPMARRAA
jgi:hypothetical protein